MNYTQKNNRRKQYYNPLENIFHEMMNIPIQNIVNQKNIKYNYPSANIQELEDKFLVHIMLPGMSKKDIDIKINNKVLIISNKMTENEDSGSTKEFKLQEFNYLKFERKFQLPNTVLLNSIKAKLSKGILSISISKDPNSERTIDIV